MTRSSRGALIVVGLTAVAASVRSEPPSDGVSIVQWLSADELRGRGADTPDGERAGQQIESWMESAGLAPLFGESYRQQLDGVPHAFNVGGIVRGTMDEVVVVGAHYDGLGVPASGEFAGQIHNGADDNASGVAALLSIARHLAALESPERGVAVVAFTGEERGLLGSEFFVTNPPFDLARAAAMINLDTVGRLESDRLIVFGTATAEEFPEILRGVNFGFRFDLALQDGDHGASDHTPFLQKGIPVLHFFTGARPEYHRPTDDAALVNHDGVTKIGAFVAELAAYLATDATPLTFRPPGVARAEPTPGSTRRRVSFGSIPDFAQESGGILLSGVMPGSAAEEAGLAAGDTLVEIEGISIDTIGDFQGVLASHEPGDRVTVRYVRGGEERTCEVVLRERK